MDFKVFIYRHETIIYARGKRMAYINFPLNIVLSYVKSKNVSVSVHMSPGIDFVSMQASIESCTPPGCDLHIIV
jgi:hypothetical protein